MRERGAKNGRLIEQGYEGESSNRAAPIHLRRSSFQSFLHKCYLPLHSLDLCAHSSFSATSDPSRSPAPTPTSAAMSQAAATSAPRRLRTTSSPGPEALSYDAADKDRGQRAGRRQGQRLPPSPL